MEHARVIDVGVNDGLTTLLESPQACPSDVFVGGSGQTLDAR